MGKAKSDIMDKITDRMDRLQEMMESNTHIDDPDAVAEVIISLSMYSSIMEDGDKDYVDCAIWALEEKKPWK